MLSEAIVLDLCAADSWETELSAKFCEHVKDALKSVFWLWKISSVSPFILHSELTLYKTDDTSHQCLFHRTSPSSFSPTDFLLQLDSIISGVHTKTYHSLGNCLEKCVSEVNAGRILILSTRAKCDEKFINCLSRLQDAGCVVDLILYTTDVESPHLNSSASRSSSSRQQLLAEVYSRGIDIFGITDVTCSFYSLYVKISQWLFESTYHSMTLQFENPQQNNLNYKVYQEVVPSFTVPNYLCACHQLPVSTHIHLMDQNSTCQRCFGMINSSKHYDAVSIGGLTVPCTHVSDVFPNWMLTVIRRVPLDTIPLGMINGPAMLVVPNLDDSIAVDEDVDVVQGELHKELLEKREVLLLKGSSNPLCNVLSVREVSSSWFVLIPEEGSFSFTLLPMGSFEYCIPITKLDVPAADLETNLDSGILDSIPVMNFNLQHLRTGIFSRVSSLLRVPLKTVVPSSGTVSAVSTPSTTHQPHSNTVQPMTNAFTTKSVVPSLTSIPSIGGKKSLSFKRVSTIKGSMR
ncbi:hypothetical protein GEMRC1_004088 [Eukaryota sp. GEM-RC1]